jgi:hypothetical protein
MSYKNHLLEDKNVGGSITAAIRLTEELNRSNVVVECDTISNKILIIEFVNTDCCICNLSERARSKRKFTILALDHFLHSQLE